MNGEVLYDPRKEHKCVGGGNIGIEGTVFRCECGRLWKFGWDGWVPAGPFLLWKYRKNK